MIVFEGKMSAKNKLFMLGLYKTKLILGSILFCIASPLFVLPACIFFSTLGLIFFILVPVVLIGGIICITECICPSKVVIDDNNIALYSKALGKNAKPEELIFDDIISIEDHGDFYLFIVEMQLYFICQKDLLKTGSLEDFEKLFADKIGLKTKE